MHHLRPTATPRRGSLVSRKVLTPSALLVVLLTAATLTSCGFDYPTDKVNTIAGGENNREASVDALGIRVLATATGEGRLIGALANNDASDASLDAVTGEGVTTAEFEPIAVAARRGVNLVDVDPINLTGDFTAGDVLPLTITFSTGESVSLNVPVVKACYQYTQVPSPTAEASDETESAGNAEGTEGTEAGEDAAEGADLEADGEHADEHSEGGDATFNCSDVAPAPEGAH